MVCFHHQMITCRNWAVITCLVHQLLKYMPMNIHGLVCHGLQNLVSGVSQNSESTVTQFTFKKSEHEVVFNFLTEEGEAFIFWTTHSPTSLGSMTPGTSNCHKKTI
ncbi:hypothetical protein CHS0354_037527 [Potamilus streckersoni]|uniref:Uncharacterized protein n=1 Tax=Potamilus streckersoni TaxID=2493646 RepID=A0AAE0VHL7_9BIVA|nr:hypothetical protein CHS0354_037527 [Potamilus streckersoni]